MEENNQRSTVIRDIFVGSISLLLLLIMLLVNANNKIGIVRKVQSSENNGIFTKIICLILIIVFTLFIVSLLASMILRFLKVENKASNISFSALNILNVFPTVFIILLILDTFFLSTGQVDGPSMLDTLSDDEVVLISRVGLNKLNTGDILIIDLLDNENQDNLIVKRLWAKEGDVISFRNEEGNAIFVVNGEEINTGNAYGRSYVFFENYTLGEGEIFVIGDHFGNSLDSRVRGVFKTIGDDKNAEICGKVIFSLKPFGKISEPKYRLEYYG